MKRQICHSCETNLDENDNGWMCKPCIGEPDMGIIDEINEQGQLERLHEVLTAAAKAGERAALARVVKKLRAMQAGSHVPAKYGYFADYVDQLEKEAGAK